MNLVRPKRTIYAADLFCGAGGTSTGLMQAAAAMGASVELLAINHWETAVETHAANHPGANHLCASLDRLDPSKVVPRGKLDLLLASPECTHHSIARGGKPMDDQSRASGWHVLHWAERLRVESIVVENVREWASWGPIGANGRPLKSRKGETFQAFLAALRSLGYRVEFRVLNAADYGDATTRQRLFILATRRHRGARWPETSHRKPGAASLFAADRPNWRPAREVIDWTVPSRSIFDRNRPLAENTVRRIEEGIRRFWGPAAEPFLLVLRNNGAGRDLGRPLPTVTAGGTHLGLVEPFVLKTAHRGGNGAYVRTVDDPLYTITTAQEEMGIIEPFLTDLRGTDRPKAPRTLGQPVPTLTGKNGLALVEPFLVPLYGERPGQAPRTHGTGEPVPTIPATGGGKFGLCEPFVLGQQSGGAPRDIGDPVPTVATRGAIGMVEPFLIPYYTTGVPHPTSEPVGTISTRDRFGLLEGRQLDIHFRMLQPPELAAAMSFPDGYRFKGTKEAIVRQIGNAVPVRTARALCAAALEESRS